MDDSSAAKIIKEQDNDYQKSLDRDVLQNGDEMQLALLLQTIAEEEQAEQQRILESCVKEPPPEPENSRFGIQFCISGKRIRRKFAPEYTLQHVKDFINWQLSQLDLSDERWCLIDPCKPSYHLIKIDGQYDKGTLQKLGLRNTNLVVLLESEL